MNKTYWHMLLVNLKICLMHIWVNGDKELKLKSKQIFGPVNVVAVV